MTLADRIRKIRKITGLTQAEFAKELGLSGAPVISQFESGLFPPGERTMRLIEAKFGHLYSVEYDGEDEYIIEKGPTSSNKDKNAAYTPEEQEWVDKLVAILRSKNIPAAEPVKNMINFAYQFREQASEDIQEVKNRAL